jgi:Na+-transporting NADH:ubiquinone oxidoreductase subunit C
MLSATASILKKKQEYNVEIDRKTNVLKAFGVAMRDESGARIKAPDVEKYFVDHISEVLIDASTGQQVATPADAKEPLPLYVWKEDGVVRSTLSPFPARACGPPIYGYLALEQALATIAGVTFYRHGETPGLGGEVRNRLVPEQLPRQGRLRGRQRVKFEVVKGKVTDRYPQGSDHAVDGISGATLTGNGIMKFMNRP